MAKLADAGLEQARRGRSAAGKDALDRTPDLLPALRDAGVVDAGGAGFLLFLDAALHVVDGDRCPTPEPSMRRCSARRWPASARRSRGGDLVVAGVGGELDVSEQRYEVMYFLDRRRTHRRRSSRAGARSATRSWWSAATGCGTATCTPTTSARHRGGARPRRAAASIRVTDLFEEVADEHAEREALATTDAGAPTAGRTAADDRVCVVAVASGDGLASLFADLGVQGVVTGGQTMNPSTPSCSTPSSGRADQVVVLPNNKNIIPVAEQVDALTSKSVASCPPGRCPRRSPRSWYDPTADASAQTTRRRWPTPPTRWSPARSPRRCATPTARSGSRSPRATGSASCAATASSRSPRRGGAADGGCSSARRPDRELVTIITGADADAAVTDAHRGWLADDRGDVEVEVHHGGQPLYPYLFGVE
jgi:uncharacterized protein